MKISVFLRPRNASMAADPVSPDVALAALFENVVDNAGKKLHCHVFEGKRGTVPELEKEVAGFEFDQRGHRGVIEPCIGLLDHRFEFAGRYLIAHEF